jgi:hypothetical protein
MYYHATIKMVRIAVCIAAFSVANPILAQPWYATNSTPRSIPSISVELINGVEGDCWTNLREVREFAEEQLRLARYTVVPRNGVYRFSIDVNAFRLSSGSTECVGSYRVDINTSHALNGVFGLYHVGSHSGVAINPRNLNHLILDMVQQMTESMKFSVRGGEDLLILPSLSIGD